MRDLYQKLKRVSPILSVVPISVEERRRVIATACAAASTAKAGPSAARSQDFLYDDVGLPK